MSPKPAMVPYAARLPRQPAAARSKSTPPMSAHDAYDSAARAISAAPPASTSRAQMRAREDADGEEREARDEEAVLGAVERVDRRQARDACERLALEAPLLEQVGDGRGEGEREERDAEQVATRRGTARARCAGAARSSTGPTNRDASRNASACGATNAPDDVDAQAEARDHVHQAHEHRGDAQREVNPLDRAHVQDERPHADLRGVQRHPQGDQPRREAYGPVRPAEQERHEQDRGGEVRRGGGPEEQIGEQLELHVGRSCYVREISASS